MADSPLTSEVEDEPQQAVVDLPKFQKYLRKFVLTYYDEDEFDGTEAALDTGLQDPVNNDVIKRFISDNQIRALLVRANITKGPFSSSH